MTPIFDRPHLTTTAKRGLYWYLLATLLTSKATAQIAPNNSNVETFSNIEEVIVTASKRQISNFDFPGSVSVITTDTINKNATLADITKQVPGISLVDAGPRNPASLVMRGLRTDSVGSNDFGSDGGTVASYIDNIPLQGYFAPPAISLKDLQQIEILRGPQGTLYGNASIGGLIRYVTAKPDLTRNSVNINTSLSQTAHSDGLNNDVGIIANIPLITDTLGLRVMLDKEHNDGFIDDPYLLSGPAKDINSDQTKQARVSMLWQPSAEFSLSGSYHYQKNDVDDRQATNKSFTGDDYTASNRYAQPVHGELTLSSLDANYQFDWATLTASFSHYDYNNHQRADQTDYLLTLDDIYQWGYYSADKDFSAYTTGVVDVKKNSAEMRLVSPDDQPFRWLAGIFYSADDANLLYFDTAPGFADFSGELRPHDLDYYFTQAEKLKELSLYTEVSYTLKPDWDMTLGARRFRYKDNLDACSLTFPAKTIYEGDNYPLECKSGSDIHTGTLGKFSTTYKINPQQMLYFTVADGFRRGGANLLPVNIQHNRAYNPDTSINYELGVHNDFLEHKLQLNAAVFYIDWKDIQVATVTEHVNITANAARARSRGIELEAIAQLAQHWTVRTGYSFTNAELTQNAFAINGGANNGYTGDTLPGSPRNQWNLGINYKYPMGAAIFTAGTTLSYLSDVYTALNKEFTDYSRLDGYSTLNANLGVTWRNWNLGAFINNIANTRGITGRRAHDLFGDQGQFEYITRPRTTGLTINYQY